MSETPDTHGRRSALRPSPTSLAVQRPPALDQLKESLRQLALTLLDRAVAVVSNKVDDVAHALDEIAARGGPKASALLGGLRAKLGGRNPVLAAIRAGVVAMSPGAKVALVLGLVLAIVLLPVALLLLLIALIVLLVVWAVQHRSPG